MSDNKIVENLEKLIEIGIALSEDNSYPELLELILYGAKSLTHSDGGTLYSIENDTIKMDIVHSTSLAIHLGGLSDDPITFPNIPLYLEDGSPNYKNVVSYAYHHNKSVNITDAYNDKQFDFSGVRKFDAINDYHSKAFLAIPLRNHENDIIGILQLINPQEKGSNKVIAYDHIAMRLTEALASQASMVLTKHQLIRVLEEMFESVIELTASAIDNKSPYTGGHCRRVPELTLSIADAASATEKGYLKDFKLSSTERYALKIAGWLHDCGKITTPEYVVDKATKLETIFDRIELIETRFEVLQRDVEIKYLKERLEALENNTAAPSHADFLAAQQSLTDDINFIKQMNTGTEYMPPENQQRILDIAKMTWLKLGIEYDVLSQNEVHNLNIAKGTLTEKERLVINSHITATISMLEKINFPKHLKNVPEYAAGHHERMDGTGYPNGLTREQMSVPARIMAIADIFEALTAKDRPYKKGKSLSEALTILGYMKKDNHIDPDIYDVFIENKLYLQYADEFLDDWQIDI